MWFPYYGSYSIREYKQRCAGCKPELCCLVECDKLGYKYKNKHYIKKHKSINPKNNFIFVKRMKKVKIREPTKNNLYDII